MKAAPLLLAVALCAAPATAGENPLSKVLELMGGLSAKVKADGEQADKSYRDYFEWCDETSQNLANEVKTGKMEKLKLEALANKLASNIEVCESKIEDLAGSVSTNEEKLKKATVIRAKEAADFKAGEDELVSVVDTLDRAIGILEKEMQTKASSLAQLSTKTMTEMVQSLGVIADAAALSGTDRNRLLALAQAQDDASEDEDEVNAPKAEVYKEQDGGIFELLEDLKDKSEAELAELRKAEADAKHNYEMVRQSLKDELAADSKDLEGEKSSKAAAEEGKAGAEGDLKVTEKELARAEEDLAKTKATCMTVAADHEGSIRARVEELAVIAKATKVLEETTGAAEGQAYSLLQTKSVARNQRSASGRAGKAVALVRELAHTHHSAALAQLASRLSAIERYGAGQGGDPFGKVRKLIQDMMGKLQKQAEEDATEKAYCDQEMSTTESKKGELDDAVSKSTAKIDQADAKSAELKEQVKLLQGELGELTKSQSKMDAIRQEEHATYLVAKKDLEEGLSGVQKALDILRDYYASKEDAEGGAAMIQQSDTSIMQQPEPPANAEKAEGAGTSIIGILEVVSSDFGTDLSKVETEEADEQSAYEKTTQENKEVKAAKEQDVILKTQEFNGLDKSISELSSDLDTVNTELSAVNEYYGKLKERCVAKPETYEERKKRRDAEIAGLKEALSVLGGDSFLQRRSHRAAP